MSALQLDEIGPWSEVKLEILRKYASAYSRIMAARGFHHEYIDGFAGAGVHLSRSTGELVLGSPLNALAVEPAFERYTLVDLDGDKVESLCMQVGSRPDVSILHGDCTEVLTTAVLPRVRYGEYRRALCIVDPYGLDVGWDVVAMAGGLKTVDLFLNFPVMHMNRGVFWDQPERCHDSERARMTRFWGDDSWRSAKFRSEPTLFADVLVESKLSNQAVVDEYCRRMRKIAGFSFVADPLPMKNSTGAVVYYLVFASAQGLAKDIVSDIFAKYR